MHRGRPRRAGAVGADDVISFDMGGTTAKVGIVRDGRPERSPTTSRSGGKGSFGGTRAGTGFPLKIPVVDLAEVGAGGGSIACVDAGGALRVGPRSAGADPGPGVLRARRAPSRPSPTPTSCSATSTPRASPAA